MDRLFLSALDLQIGSECSRLGVFVGMPRIGKRKYPACGAQSDIGLSSPFQPSECPRSDGFVVDLHGQQRPTFEPTFSDQDIHDRNVGELAPPVGTMRQSQRPNRNAQRDEGNHRRAERDLIGGRQ